MTTQLMYREHLLDHYKHPKNFGHLNDPDIENEEDNPLCGDVVGIEIQLDETTHQSISTIKFQGHGCAISVAAASMLTEFLEGKTLDQAAAFTREEMLELLGAEITAMRMKCALLAWNVLQNGLIKYKNGELK
jgi:nitrogen fixation protein NifU and related proteins